jgi:hypothetical protein
MVHDDGTIDGAIPAPRGPVFVVGHLATPGWLAVLAGPLLGSRGVLENMSGWNAAGKLLDPSLLGSSGSATITRLHASFASQVDDAVPTSNTPAMLIGNWLGWGGRDTPATGARARRRTVYGVTAPTKMVPSQHSRWRADEALAFTCRSSRCSAGGASTGAASTITRLHASFANQVDNEVTARRASAWRAGRRAQTPPSSRTRHQRSGKAWASFERRLRRWCPRLHGAEHVVSHRGAACGTVRRRPRRRRRWAVRC